jgi:hypothetical protein
MTVGLAVGCVLIAIGTLINWLDDSKLDVLALGTLAFSFMLLCILVRNERARRNGAQWRQRVADFNEAQKVGRRRMSDAPSHLGD